MKTYLPLIPLFVFAAFACGQKNTNARMADAGGLTDSIGNVCKREIRTMIESGTENDSATVMMLDYAGLSCVLGEPAVDVIFPVSKASRRQRFLRDYFPNRAETLVRESEWDIDTAYNLTVWYTYKDSVWTPVTFDLWKKGTEF